MSVKIMTLVFDHFPKGGADYITAIVLADHCNDEGKNIFAGVKRLAARTHQSERALQYCLRRLQASEFLLLVEEARGGRSSSTDLSRRNWRTRTYWINPAFIAHPATFFATKGAKDAPTEAQETVQSGVGNGARAVAPEPSENRHKDNRHVGGGAADAQDRCRGEIDGKRCTRRGSIFISDGWWCSSCSTGRDRAGPSAPSSPAATTTAKSG